MNQPYTVNVHILDKEYCISCPPDERSNLEGAARYLDSKMREIRSAGKVIGADRIAVMAALNITHEMLYRQSAAQGLASDERDQVRELIDRVDQGLQGQGNE